MHTNFIDKLDKIKPPSSQLKNFDFVKSFCQTIQLKVTKVDFTDANYDIIVYFFGIDKNFKFCFNFEDGIPLVYLKEVTDVNR